MAQQRITYKQGNDSGENDVSSIQPVADGEAANQTTFRRPSDNLRVRTEAVRTFADNQLRLRDEDRAFGLFSSGNITWDGTVASAGTGKFHLGADLWLVPFLTPGKDSNTPPVQSFFGTLTLNKTGPAAGIVVTSRKRSYEYGDKITVEILLDNGIGSPAVVVTSGTPLVHITVTVKNTTTLNDVMSAITADTNANNLVSTALAGGALGADIIVSPQAIQTISGNYDGEAHIITDANLQSFFTADSNNLLKEGDTLAVWYNELIEGTVSGDSSDPKGGSVLGGRFESIPENTNTTLPTGSLFNSRVHPERLPNAIPVAKVMNGSLIMTDGTKIAKGVGGVALGASTITINDDGSAVGPFTTINFIDNLEPVDAGSGVANVSWTGANVKNQGTTVTNSPFTDLDFTDRGVTATDGTGKALVTIPGFEQNDVSSTFEDFMGSLTDVSSITTLNPSFRSTYAFLSGDNSHITYAQMGGIGGPTSSGTMGEVACNQGTAGATQGYITLEDSNIGTLDFSFKVKVKFAAKAQFDTVANDGILVGPTNFNLSGITCRPEANAVFIAGNDSTNWKFRVGSTNNDTGVAITTNYVVLYCYKKAGNLVAYIDNTQVYNSAFSTSITTFIPTVAVNMLGTGSTYFLLDYMRFNVFGRT